MKQCCTLRSPHRWLGYSTVNYSAELYACSHRGSTIQSSSGVYLEGGASDEEPIHIGEGGQLLAVGSCHRACTRQDSTGGRRHTVSPQQTVPAALDQKENRKPSNHFTSSQESGGKTPCDASRPGREVPLVKCGMPLVCLRSTSVLDASGLCNRRADVGSQPLPDVCMRLHEQHRSGRSTHRCRLRCKG